MAADWGHVVVLTADRTLTADYRLLFDGMLAASQTTMTPVSLMGWLLMPRHVQAGPRAMTAPLGLRRIEAALLNGGFSSDEVVVADDAHLGEAVGTATRVIGISAGEPAGHGMNSSTMTGIVGGYIYPEAMFRRVVAKIRRHMRDRRLTAKMVMGGPGAWQLAGDPAKRRSLGIDHVVTGYAEENIAQVFRALVQGDSLPEVVVGEWKSPSSIPPIRSASTMGVVELSRGCGLGCSYCTISRVPMAHLPPETILADVRTNVAAGLTSIAVLSEDFFRYGASGLSVNPSAILSLLESLRKIPELRLIQIDHANIISIAQYTDEQLKQVRDLLVGDTGARYLWVNIGVETASGRLLKELGGAGKMNRCPAEEWGDLCARQLRRLCRAGFLPMASLLIGAPGETEEDVRRTLAWVESLSEEAITIFPVLYAPIDQTAGPSSSQLTRLHWQLIRTCYRLNFRWIPRMYWDNQAAAGVSLAKRLTLQCLGRGQILQWKGLLAWHQWRSRK